MNIKGIIGDMVSYMVFLLMGGFGIYVGIYSIMHNKDPNYMILLGGIGIIIVILTSIIDKNKDKKKNNKKDKISSNV